MRRRGKNLLLSPIDWAMIEAWQERGIPLHIVLRAIENVFDGFDKNPGPRTIKGLLYCREEIEAQYTEWLAMQAGKSAETTNGAEETFSRETVSKHIEEKVQILQKLRHTDLSESLDRAAARLSELNMNLTEDFEVIDKSLADIENFLDNELLTKTDGVHLKKVEKEIAAQLREYKSGMEPDVYKNTFRLMLLKRLREEAEVPRLSLFYL